VANNVVEESSELKNTIGLSQMAVAFRLQQLVQFVPVPQWPAMPCGSYGFSSSSISSWVSSTPTAFTASSEATAQGKGADSYAEGAATTGDQFREHWPPSFPVR